MRHVPKELRGAVSGFVVLLCKGLIEDERWSWDLDNCDWKRYQSGLADPSILRTTMVVFLNTLKMDEAEPPFQSHEIEELWWVYS